MNDIYTSLNIMPSNEIPNEDLGTVDLGTVDGAAPGSDTDHNVPARILGKRPREDGEPNSDEGQVRLLSIGYAS